MGLTDIMRRRPSLFVDPRHYQIAVLGCLLAYGIWGLDFEVRAAAVAAIVPTALLTQWLWGRRVGLPSFDPRSPLISSLSLCLLLRTDQWLLAAVATVIAISSKFLIRSRGKHVFNPTNFGLVVSMLLFDGVWISPGQWGTVAWLAFLLAGAGMWVTFRAERLDVTWAFLGFWSAGLFGRAWWLGDPWAIPWHQVQSGALLVFAFFMISDPKTTPDSRAGRVTYALLVAWLAGWIQFALYRPNALIWSLVLCAPTVPLFDAWLPARRFAWPGSRLGARIGPSAPSASFETAVPSATGASRTATAQAG